MLAGTAYSNASAPVARRRVEAQSAGADDDDAIEEDDVQQVKQLSAAACIHAACTVMTDSSQTKFTAAHWHGVCKCISRLTNMTGHVCCAAACGKAENMHAFMPILHDARRMLHIVRHCSMLSIKQHICDKLCSATLAHRACWLAATRTSNNRLNIAMNYCPQKGLFSLH